MRRLTATYMARAGRRFCDIFDLRRPLLLKKPVAGDIKCNDNLKIGTGTRFKYDFHKNKYSHVLHSALHSSSSIEKGLEVHRSYINVRNSSLPNCSLLIHEFTDDLNVILLSRVTISLCRGVASIASCFDPILGFYKRSIFSSPSEICICKNLPKIRCFYTVYF